MYQAEYFFFKMIYSQHLVHITYCIYKIDIINFNTQNLKIFNLNISASKNICSQHNTLPVHQKNMCTMASCTLKTRETVTSHLVREQFKSADFQGTQKKTIPRYWRGMGRRTIKCIVPCFCAHISIITVSSNFLTSKMT